MGSAGSVIELVGDEPQVLLGAHGQTGALGEVLAHLRVVREPAHQGPGDLLGRELLRQLFLHERPQPVVDGELRRFRAPGPRLRGPVRGGGDVVAAPVGAPLDLPADRGAMPPQRRRDRGDAAPVADHHVDLFAVLEGQKPGGSGSTPAGTNPTGVDDHRRAVDAVTSAAHAASTTVAPCVRHCQNINRARSDAGGRPIITICNTLHHQGWCSARLNPPPVKAVLALFENLDRTSPQEMMARHRRWVGGHTWTCAPRGHGQLRTGTSIPIRAFTRQRVHLVLSVSSDGERGDGRISAVQ